MTPAEAAVAAESGLSAAPGRFAENRLSTAPARAAEQGRSRTRSGVAGPIGARDGVGKTSGVTAHVGEEAGTSAGAAEAGAHTGVPAVDTVFAAMPIPPEVETRMRGVSYPEGATVPLGDLRYLRLSYVDFNGAVQTGEMVCNQAIAMDLVDIFRQLYLAAYPIRSIRLIDDFGGSDDASMEADNTSCFNYRKAVGLRRLSRHAEGMAVDVNPLENPYVRGQSVRPASAKPYADREKDFPHKIDRTDLCYKLFLGHGFSWGGTWRSARDYQHFEK
jgi:hypothetical protein